MMRHPPPPRSYLPDCTPEKLLSGILTTEAAPGQFTALESAHPDCRAMRRLGTHGLTERLRGRSAFLIGDCWERRLIEHVCPRSGRRDWYTDESGETFAIYCQFANNFTLGHVHIAGVGSEHSRGMDRGYMSSRMAAKPSLERAVEMLDRFRSTVLAGRDPTLVTVQSYAWDFGELAERTRGTEQQARAAQGDVRLYAWWSAHKAAFLRSWLADAEALSTAVASSSPGSHVYWNTRHVPTIEYVKGTVGRAFNGTTPNLPLAFHSMSELVRSQHGRWRPRVGLLDFARYMEGNAGWFHGDGLHQTEWASRAFADVLSNLVAVLPDGPAR